MYNIRRVYVCVYVYMYIYTHTHLSIHTHTQIPEKDSNVLSNLKAMLYFKITFNTLMISLLLHFCYTYTLNIMRIMTSNYTEILNSKQMKESDLTCHWKLLIVPVWREKGSKFWEMSQIHFPLALAKNISHKWKI